MIIFNRLCREGWKGIAAELIRGTNSGIVILNTIINQIVEGISQLSKLFIDGHLSTKFKSEHIENYSRKHLTTVLSDVNNSLIEQ